MEGWICLHRKIKDHWLWKQKRKFSKFEAWVDILLSVNHADTKINIDNKIIEVKTGSFITSEVKLSIKWGWDRTTVRRFLKTLEEEKMCHKIATTKYTTLTVDNWEFYQFNEHQNTQQMNTNNNNIYNYNTMYTDEEVLQAIRKGMKK